MKIYLAGPMTGLPEHNFPAFAQVAQLLDANGHTVVSPHEIDHDDDGVRGSLPWGNYIREALMAMLPCDTIALLPGWEQSRGATLELFIATQVGMEVIHLPHEWPDPA